MTQPVMFSLAEHPLHALLCAALPAERGALDQRQFPDGESYLRICTAVEGRDCIVLADLSHPDGKYLPLIFLANTLREYGARRVGLLAPYLAYMRQDRRFVDGEAVTSRIFAAQLSAQFDWLLTVDPHLHRYHSLDEIYSIPGAVVQGAPALAAWLKARQNCLLVGPDSESEQWVGAIAQYSGHPFVVGEKQRFGDRDVRVSLPDVSAYRSHTAVIIDDVISSGQTLFKCIEALQAQGIKRIECAAVHGIFADGSDQRLLDAGLQALVTCNTIAHHSNAVDVSPLLLPALRAWLAG